MSLLLSPIQSRFRLVMYIIQEVDVFLFLPRGPYEVAVSCKALLWPILPPVALLEYALDNTIVVTRSNIELLSLINFIFLLIVAFGLAWLCVATHIGLDHARRDAIC